jgi:arsenate reductase (glutaredoxin)
MILYGIPNCSTVKKARDWLDANAIVYTFHDFKKLGASTPIIDNWLTQYPHEKLINRAGLTWRGLDDATKNSINNNAAAIALMQAKPSLIKRPILELNSKIIALGFDRENYEHISKHF